VGDRKKQADKGWRQNLCRPRRAASQRGGGSFVATGARAIDARDCDHRDGGSEL